MVAQALGAVRKSSVPAAAAAVRAVAMDRRRERIGLAGLSALPLIAVAACC